MSSVEITLVGDDTVRTRFERLPTDMHDRLVREMQRVTIELQSIVRDEKLSGQVLKNRTGTLRRSINQRVDDQGDSIIGTVGADMREAAYAAAHEYGFSGIVSVREYTRRITQAFGRPIAAREVVVHAHSMHMNLPERSYLRSSLREYGPTAIERLRSAVGEVISE